MSARTSRPLRRPLIALASVLAVLGLGEGVLRLFGPPRSATGTDAWTATVHRASPLEGLAYELAPGRDVQLSDMHVRTNELGMRNPPLRPSQDRARRIVVLGDSYTFGFGVEEPETFVRRMETLLNAGPLSQDGRPFEVLNLGVGGYGTRDEAIVLRRRALALGPRLVVLAYTLNDPELDAIMPLRRHFEARPVWRRSRLLSRCAEALERRRLVSLGEGRYIRSLYEDGRKWASVVRGFEDMAEALSQAARPMLLVVFPFAAFGPSWESYLHLDVHRRVLAEGQRVGFETLDLLPTYGAHAPRALRVAEFDEHPSVLAHGLAAEAIVRELECTPRLRNALMHADG